MAKAVEAREKRRQAARKEGDRSVWFGLGMMGVVGWAVAVLHDEVGDRGEKAFYMIGAVAVPALIGVVAGLWLDAAHETERSWTLTLLLAGVALGCFNAWFWVQRESRRDGR